MRQSLDFLPSIHLDLKNIKVSNKYAIFIHLFPGQMIAKFFKKIHDSIILATPQIQGFSTWYAPLVNF